MEEIVIDIKGGDKMTHDAHGACTDPHQSDILWVTTKPGDVPLDPEQGQMLIMETKVARNLVRLQ